MRIKYVIAKYERIGNEIKHRPIFEFDDYSEAKYALNKIKSNQYTLLPLVID